MNDVGQTDERSSAMRRWWSPVQKGKKEERKKMSCSFLYHAPTQLPRLPQDWGKGKEGQDLSTGSSLWRPSLNPHSPPFASQTSAS